MLQILLVVHLLIAIAMVVTILLQRSEGGALGIGGGGGGGGGGMGLFSARGTANALSRSTAILAICFFATSIGLALLANTGRGESGSILDAPTAETPALPAEPTEPSVPLSQ